MAKQKKEEVTLEELIKLKNSALLVLEEINKMITELAASLASIPAENSFVEHATSEIRHTA